MAAALMSMPNVTLARWRRWRSRRRPRRRRSREAVTGGPSGGHSGGHSSDQPQRWTLGVGSSGGHPQQWHAFCNSAGHAMAVAVLRRSTGAVRHHHGSFIANPLMMKTAAAGTVITTVDTATGMVIRSSATVTAMALGACSSLLYGLGGYGYGGYAPRMVPFLRSAWDASPPPSTEDLSAMPGFRATGLECPCRRQRQAGARVCEKGRSRFGPATTRELYAWRHAVIDDPQNPLVLMLLGQALFATGHFDEAAGATQGAMQMLPKEHWGVVVKNFRELYGNTLDYTTHLRALEKAEAEKPKDPAMRFLAGFHYSYLGYPKESIDQLDKGLKIAPRDEMAQQLRDEMQAKLPKPAAEVTTPATPATP